MTIRVREARLPDAEDIARVHVHTWQTSYRGLVPDDFLDALSLEQRSKGWRQMLAAPDPREGYWTAELDDELIGFASAGPSRDEDAGAHTGELYAIYVSTERQGVGAGQALMGAATSWLSERYEVATLWTLEENAKTRRFYERCGWTFDGTTLQDDRGSFVLSEVRYRRDLW